MRQRHLACNARRGIDFAAFQEMQARRSKRFAPSGTTFFDDLPVQRRAVLRLGQVEPDRGMDAFAHDDHRRQRASPAARRIGGKRRADGGVAVGGHAHCGEQ